ncbi:hypothetical protein CPB84DRAFT_1055945 [Gymnopilus junonius]|uniref:Uncharacterized protein n=1 Tax=Gymnopilus junonius TaxID=109634 RepID=A0A9P5NMY7_GYMJU|nr:hypothetical protein CPB84DRAFT_1055945 [Gymnopilus junonius]
MSTTVSSSTKNLVEGGNSLAAFAGRRRPGMSSRKKMTSNGSIYRLPAEFNPDAPIYGASPNNADHDHIYHPDWNSVQPAPSAHPQGPQTRQRRLLLGSPSLTGFLRTLGSPNGADTPSPPHTSNGSANGHGGSNEALNPRSTAASRPSHIDLNEENHRSRDTPRVGVKNSAPYFEVPRTHSPEKYRCSPTTSARQRLNQVPEEMEVPSSSVVADGCGTYSDQRPQTSTAGQGHQYYGSVGCGPAPRTRSDVDPGTGPRYVEGVLMDDDDASSLSSEEEEWLLDSELAKEGLYRGNYKNLIILYTLVPLSTLLAFVLLAILPVLAFPSSSHSLFPYPPYLPFPIPEVSTAMALWSLSYLIRDFLYSTSLVATSWIPPPSYRFPKFIPVLTSILSAFLQTNSSSTAIKSCNHHTFQHGTTMPSDVYGGSRSGGQQRRLSWGSSKDMKASLCTRTF